MTLTIEMGFQLIATGGAVLLFGIVSGWMIQGASIERPRLFIGIITLAAAGIVVMGAGLLVALMGIVAVALS